MSNRSKSPPPKSSKIVDSSEFGTSIDVDDDLIVNGKISGNTALNIINRYDLQIGNRIGINGILFKVAGHPMYLQKTNVAYGKKRKRRKTRRKTRRPKRRPTKRR